MTHLSLERRLDYAERPDAASGDLHLAACEACRQEVEKLRATLADLQASPAPEPSPLFWDHFSARVARAVRDTASPVEPLPLRRGGWSWVLGSVALAAALLVVAFGLPARTPVSPAEQQRAEVAETGEDALAWTEAEAGEDWMFIADVAESSGDETTLDAGVLLRPGAAEAAFDALTAEEQQELARLLREEIARTRQS